MKAWLRPVAGLVSIVAGLGTTAWADDADVLPPGVFRLQSEARFYLPIKQRYGPDGDPEDLGVDYNRALDSRVFRLLTPLDRLVGGRASLGDAKVSMEIDLIEVDNWLQYGLMSRLTVGVLIPYIRARTNVKARLDSGPGSSANVGRNPRAGQPGQPPVIPLAAGGLPFTTEDVQQLLGAGLPGIPGFGYRRFASRTNEGLGDIEAGFRYQYVRTDDWRLAVTAGARFPTGQVDDPDDLVDYGRGTGAYALLFRSNNDYTLSHLWHPGQPPGGAGELILNGTVRYDLVLPDEVTKRVPDDVNNPITTNRERVNRDIGDKFEFELGARYYLPKSFHLLGRYRYGFKLEDDVSGKKGFRYRSLEEETARTEHIAIVGISYSTIELYRARRFLVPLVVTGTYRYRFAGSNNALRSQYLGVELQVFF